jgi:large subunit ribosomal protein L17
MRHLKKSEKFSRSRGQRKALVRSLLRSLIVYERIITTESKAKALRTWIDKLITWSKENSLHNRRLTFRLLNDHLLVKKLFENIGPRFKNIHGGYTRIIDLGYRKGDGAKLSLMELTKIERKHRKHKEKKETEQIKGEPEKKREEKVVPKKEKPKKGIISGVKSIFKKERDAL